MKSYFKHIVLVILAVCCLCVLFACGEAESTEPAPPKMAEDNAFSAQIKPTDSWQSENEYFLKYELTVKNSGERDITDWSIEIPCDGSAKVTDKWNCKAAVKGGMTVLSPEDYTRQVFFGREKTDMGFIIGFDKEAALGAFTAYVTFGDETLAYEGKVAVPAPPAEEIPAEEGILPEEAPEGESGDEAVPGETEEAPVEE